MVKQCEMMNTWPGAYGPHVFVDTRTRKLAELLCEEQEGLEMMSCWIEWYGVQMTKREIDSSS